MSFSFRVIIPARYAASRLPGKPLEMIGKRPLLQHVYDAASRSGASSVLVATDDDRIRRAAESFGARVIMTSNLHQSGTDRLAEVVTLLDLPADEIIVNLQGDEFNMPAALIDQVASALHDNPGYPIATLCEKITRREEVDDPGVVKVVFDSDHGAIYFSRSPIPWTAEGGSGDMPGRHWRHIGLYAYRSGFLREYTRLPGCALEQNERLEQLRALFYGHRIRIEEAITPCGIGIDTGADLERARRIADS